MCMRNERITSYVGETSESFRVRAKRANHLMCRRNERITSCAGETNESLYVSAKRTNHFMCRRNDPALLLCFSGPPLTTPFYTLRCVNALDRLKQVFRTSRVNIRRLTDVGLLLIQAVPLASRRWSNSNTRVNILPR